MKFDWRQAQLLRNLGVLDLLSVLQRQAFHPLGHIRARSDGAATAKGLELDVLDDSALIDADLELHYISATARKISARVRGQGEDKAVLTQARQRGQYRRQERSLGGSQPGKTRRYQIIAFSVWPDWAALTFLGCS